MQNITELRKSLADNYQQMKDGKMDTQGGEISPRQKDH